MKSRTQTKVLLRALLFPALVLMAATTLCSVASAQGAAPSAKPAGASKGDSVWTSCSEYVPKEAVRPKLEAHLDPKGKSGHAAKLKVVVHHGPGETVFPGGFRVQRGSDATVALREAGFAIPDVKGGSPPQIKVIKGDAAAVTTEVTLFFVPLPKEPGRHRLNLPSIPITVARANGQVMTLCTARQAIVVEDPIANELEPKVKKNPPPQIQREEWVAAKYAAAALGGALVVLLAALWFFRRWSAKPKVAPPKVRILPWIAAMRELDALREGDLLAKEEFEAFFDRVDVCTRRYLGARYGFDGLESTTSEILTTLARVYPPIPNVDIISTFLREGDLIKFAKVVPRVEEANAAHLRAVDIVLKTTPAKAVTAPDPKRPAQRKKKSAKRKRGGKAA